MSNTLHATRKVTFYTTQPGVFSAINHREAFCQNLLSLMSQSQVPVQLVVKHAKSITILARFRQ